MVTPLWRLLLAMVPVIVILSACSETDEAGTETNPVTEVELQELLAGNTIIGDWFGEPYRQFFDQDGTTTYVPDGARPSTGQWRVDAVSGNYESWWNDRDGWERYEVTGDGDAFYWSEVGADGTTSGRPSPFTVVEGNQLSAAES